jgi:L-threonylcarbamoyladenylate synthase
MDDCFAAMPRVPFPEFIRGAQHHIVTFPTDTVPALAAQPENAKLLFQAKQRSPQKSVIMMAADASDLWGYVVGSEPDLLYWQEVSQQHWPGALTLVLPASDRVPRDMNPLTPDTIGLRVPNSAIARHVLAQTGPLATTSANLSGQPALQTLTEIEAAFPDALMLVDDDLRSLGYEPMQRHQSGLPSTVAEWNGSSWNILRQGGVCL